MCTCGCLCVCMCVHRACTCEVFLPRDAPLTQPRAERSALPTWRWRLPAAGLTAVLPPSLSARQPPPPGHS